jgi:hypothetical protein
MSLTVEPRQKLYRTGPLPEVHIPGAFEARIAEYRGATGYDSDNAEGAQPMEEWFEFIRSRLNTFADTIRKKERWYFKILEQEDLAQKWMEEADLLESEAKALITYAVPLNFLDDVSTIAEISRGRRDGYAHLIIPFDWSHHDFPTECSHLMASTQR